MTKRQDRDAIYVKRQFATDHRAVRALLHHLSPKLPRSRCDNSRTWRDHVSHDDHAMGDSVCSGI